MILFRNVSLSRGKSTTRFGGWSFFLRKVTIFHWTWNKNTHFTDENQRKKIAKVSPSNNNYSLRIIQPFNNTPQQHTTTHNNTPQNNNNNNNTIWGGSVLTGEEPPPHSGEFNHALPQADGSTQSQLSRPMSSGHYISMEHRLRRKQLNSDSNASKKIFEREIQEKRKEETFFFWKMKKENEKHLKNQKNEEMNKKWEKMKK